MGFLYLSVVYVVPVYNENSAVFHPFFQYSKCTNCSGYTSYMRTHSPSAIYFHPLGVPRCLASMRHRSSTTTQYCTTTDSK